MPSMDWDMIEKRMVRDFELLAEKKARGNEEDFSKVKRRKEAEWEVEDHWEGHFLYKWSKAFQWVPGVSQIVEYYESLRNADLKLVREKFPFPEEEKTDKDYRQLEKLI